MIQILGYRLFETGATEVIDKLITAIPKLGPWIARTVSPDSLKLFAEVAGSRVALKGLNTVVDYLVLDPWWNRLIRGVAGAGGLLSSAKLAGRWKEEAAIFSTMVLIDAFIRRRYGPMAAQTFWESLKQMGAGAWGRVKGFFGYRAQDYITTPHITPRATPPGALERAGRYLRQAYEGQQKSGSGAVARVGAVGVSGGGAGWAKRYVGQQIDVRRAMTPLLNP